MKSICDDTSLSSAVKVQSVLERLLNSMENQLNPKQWGKHRKLCKLIEQVLGRYNDRYESTTSQQVYNRILDYLRKLNDCCDDDKTIDRAQSALEHFLDSQIVFQMFQPLLQNYLQSSQLNLKIHRNLLTLALFKCGRYDEPDIFIDILKKIENNLLLQYLRKILCQCDHMPLVLNAILLLERMYLKLYLNIDSENIRNELMGRVQSLDSECPLAHSLPDEFDFDRYQVEWCARWCVHNVMDKDKRRKMRRRLPLIKLSNDRFQVRSDQNSNHFIPVRSQFAVFSGVYFYEVTVATCGKMMFGWSTIDAQLSGDDWDLDEFDMSQMFKSSDDCDYIFLNLSDCHAGDVIGCLIDIDNRKFVFYCNGKEVVGGDEDLNDKFQNQVILSPFYATAHLSPKQHCYFNFGQASFRFPPNHVQFMDFHKTRRKKARKARLSETCQTEYSDHFWFKHLPVDNQVDLFYSDKIQNECDELVKRVERDIVEGRKVAEMKKKLGCTRYIQAVIEEMGKGQGGDKVDVMAQWVGSVIEVTIEDVDKAKLLQLLYPYLHLRINSTLDYTKHRNICIVLSNLIRFSEYYEYDIIRYIRNDVFTYLTRTFTETSDQWTQLFGLIALDYLKMRENGKKIIENNDIIMKFLNDHQDTARYSDIFEMCSLKHFKPLFYQLHLICEHFRDDHVNVFNRHIHLVRSNRSEVEIIDQYKHLKFSHDFLSTRSDWKWQSVRYDHSSENRIFYFEVLLLTNGPMRIGWSTKRTELSDGDKLGEDEFSIVFNRYNRIILHQNTPTPTECIPQWKAGDVVGCLINRETRRFYFFLNGHPLPLPDKLYFSTQLPYYPTLSLSAHQQVYSNFGQSKFKFTQPNIKHLELELSIQKSLLGLSSKPVTSIDIHNSSFTNTVLATGSRNNFRDLNFKSKSLTISPSIANHNNKREFTKVESEFTNCETSSKQISTKRKKFHSDSQQLSSTCVDEHEDCKQKYAILLKKYKRLKQQQDVVFIHENTKLKQRIAELEKEILTIKAEKYDDIKSFFNKLNK